MNAIPFDASGASAEFVPAEELARSEGVGRTHHAPSLLGYPATYLLIGINLAVYAAMFRFGPVPELFRAHDWGSILTASFSEGTLVRFGSSVPVLILSYGEWWRLVSSTFVHVTPLHLLLNMWCLWNLGIFGEPLLGRPGLCAVYVLTGVAGMLQSLAFSAIGGDRMTIVAGASGAVFGVAGVLIVLLSNRKLALPWEELRSLRQQVVFFAVANLVLGIAPEALPAFSPAHLRLLHLDPGSLPRIDNSAHIGGLVCGLGLGLPLFPRMTSGKSSYRARQMIVFAMAALLLCLVSYAVASFSRPAAAGYR